MILLFLQVGCLFCNFLGSPDFDIAICRTYVDMIRYVRWTFWWEKPVFCFDVIDLYWGTWFLGSGQHFLYKGERLMRSADSSDDVRSILLKTAIRLHRTWLELLNQSVEIDNFLPRAHTNLLSGWFLGEAHLPLGSMSVSVFCFIEWHEEPNIQWTL